MILLQILVIIPGLAGATPHLDEANAAFQQTARDQQLTTVGAAPVGVARLVGFSSDVEGVCRLALHAISEFEGGDARLESGVLRPDGGMLLVQSSHQIKLAPLLF